MAKLADYGNMKEAATLTAMQDIEGEPVKVLSFVIARGNYGKYVTMKIQREGGEVTSVRTASSAIQAALIEAKAKGALPVEATFVQHGRTWLAE
jgi:hypothetical protein